MARLEGLVRLVKFMLDANILIGALAGEPRVLGERLAECAEGEVVTSAIAFAEVALGSWQGKHPPLTILDQLRQRVDVLPFDHLAAKIYAQLPFRRGSFDRLIAAHALASGATLVTDNERDFADISGLRVENWTQ